MNQDLLLFTDDTYTPIGSEGTTTLKCVYSVDSYESTYTFTIKDEKIERLSINYKTNVENIEAYTAASNINEAVSYEKLNGLSVTMYGGLSDFSMNVNVIPSDYDKARVESMTEDYNTLHMVIDSITDVELYKKAINQEDIIYACE